MRRPSLLMIAVLLAACGDEPPADTPRAAAPDSSAVAADPAGAGPADSAAAAPVRTGPGLALAEDGVQVTDSAGAVRRIAFGTAEAGVAAAVGAAIGEAGEQAEHAECPVGPLTTTTYQARLQLVFQDGAFVGWAADPGSTFRTAEGIGVGSTLGQLRAAYPAATVDESSLGMEFTAGGLYGIVTSSADTGRVEIMFAGINCIFR